MMPVMSGLSTIAPTVASNTPLNNSWWGGAQDFLKFGLDSWMQVETINKLKDSGSFGQQETLTTVQTPTQVTAVDQGGNAAAQNMQQQLAGLMQNGGLVLGGVVVAVAAVVASPEFADVVGQQAASIAALAGALVAAVGKALGDPEAKA